MLIVIIFNRLLPFVFFTRTKGEWLRHFVWPLRILIYLTLPVTLVLGFCLSVAALTEERPPEQPEHPSEAVDALIEAGQEEGILEESDRELIQSVVEFGDKTVREVMTPRPEIFAVPIDTTVEQFTELLRTKPYSRVPVYEGSIDHIIGIVFAHDVLQVPDTEARHRTVGELMKTDVDFVPESKRVSELLREMQTRRPAHGHRHRRIRRHRRAWSPSRTWWRRSSARSATSTRPRPTSSAKTRIPTSFPATWTWTAWTSCSASARTATKPPPSPDW